MGRSRKTSFFEDIVELTAMLPWWAGVGMAIAAYVWLHPYAVAELPKPNVMTDMAAVALAPTLKMFATIGQYLLPGILILGAGISFFKRRKRVELHAQVAANPNQLALENMSWREFEMLVGEAFRQKGFDVLETGGGGTDGGVDLVLRKGTDQYLVQCKQWKAFKVGVTIVRELYGVMAAKAAAGGFVVTSGVFTDEARRFAEGRSIVLIDGVKLHTMIRGARPVSLNTTSNKDPIPASPACPLCGSPMVQRKSQRGINAGKAFWGCSTYPKCRGTRPIEH